MRRTNLQLLIRCVYLSMPDRAIYFKKIKKLVSPKLPELEDMLKISATGASIKKEEKKK
jgi:hypothetical protein